MDAGRDRAETRQRPGRQAPPWPRPPGMASAGPALAAFLGLIARARALPMPVRYAAAAALVAAAAGAIHLLPGTEGQDAAFLLLPPVVLAGLLFDRGAGFLAALLATEVGFALFAAPGGAGLARSPGGLATEAMFLGVALALAWLVEALHHALLDAAGSEERWRALAEALPGFAWLADPDGRLVWVGQGWRAHAGVPPEAGPFRRWGRRVHRQDRRRLMRAWLSAVSAGEPWEAEIRLGAAARGGHRWFLVRAAPVRGLGPAAPAAPRWAGTCTDVDARHRALDALAESEARFRAMADGIPQLAWMARSDGEVFWCNRRLRDYAGMTGQQTVPPGTLLRLLDPDQAGPVAASWAEAVAAGRPWERTFPMRAADGSCRWFLSRAAPVRDAAGGRVALWFGTHTDVTAQHEAEERRRVLVAELNHRVKNTLATVQSIARQTARSVPTSAGFTPAFEARLFALAAAHDLLTRHDWTGATVDEVARRALAPHLASGRVSVEGPEGLHLGPQPALALAMALGEIATNAAKHGALSVPGGRVALGWWRDDERHGVLVWEERGGPPLAPGPPSRRGFGTRLLERGLRGDLGAAAVLDFRPAGLRCTLRLPLLRVAP